MRIGLDVDGIIRDFTTALKKVYLSVYPEHVKMIKENTTWNLADSYPIGDKINEFCFNSRYTKDIFYECAYPYDDVDDGMEELKKLGHTLVIISTQTKKTELLTRKWLEYYELKFDEQVYIKADKNPNILANGKSKVDVDILFDDGHHNIEEVIKAGKKVVCRLQPWNIQFKDYYDTNGIPCVNSFKEFVEHIKANYKV